MQIPLIYHLAEQGHKMEIIAGIQFDDREFWKNRKGCY